MCSFATCFTQLTRSLLCRHDPPTPPIAPPLYCREDCAVTAVTLVSSMSALCHLDRDSADKVVTELAACLLLTYKTWRTAFKMATCMAESALADTHPLLKGLASLVCCEGEGRCVVKVRGGVL